MDADGFTGFMNEQTPPPDDKDKVITDSGWGIKPDDQPTDSGQTDPGLRQLQYDPGQPDAICHILRQLRRGINTPNRITVEAGRTTFYDINGDAFVIHGLSFGNEHLIEMLRILGMAFDPQHLRDLGDDFDGSCEFSVSRTWAWGAERTG